MDYITQALGAALPPHIQDFSLQVHYLRLYARQSGIMISINVLDKYLLIVLSWKNE